MGLFNKLKNLVSKKEEILEKELENLTEEETKAKEELQTYEKGLTKTREEFVSKLSLLGHKYTKVNEEYFEELEDLLIMADIGVNTVMKFIE